jgi:translocator protein
MKRKIFISVLVCLLLGLGSGLFTAAEIKSWYTLLIKPSWNPPNWVFAPVWTILYILMGISFALLWQSTSHAKRNPMRFFAFQFILNLCWSFIFFRLHQTGLAFIELIVLFVFIVLTCITAYQVDKVSAYLLFPYLLWVIFAGTLNGAIWYLNSSTALLK